MAGFLEDMSQLASRGFAWWIAELRGCLPHHASRSAHVRDADVVVACNASGALYLVQDGDGEMLADAGSEEADRAAVETLVRLARARPQTKVHLRLPQSACFERRIDIPPSARREANAILALDFERSTPFKASDVYLAHTIEPSTEKKGWFVASQLLVKRKFADRIIASIEDLGAKVASLDVWSADGRSARPVNLLQQGHADEAASDGSRRASMAVMLVALGLAVTAYAIAMERRQMALADLDTQVSAARAEADTLRQKRDAALALQDAARAAVAIKLARPTMVSLINELTRLLPDDVYLADLKIDGNNVDIAGAAKSAAAIVPVLERSSVFKDAVLTSPVTFDGAANNERFSLRLRMRATTQTAAAAASAAPGAEGEPR